MLPSCTWGMLLSNAGLFLDPWRWFTLSLWKLSELSCCLWCLWVLFWYFLVWLFHLSQLAPYQPFHYKVFKYFKNILLEKSFTCTEVEVTVCLPAGPPVQLPGVQAWICSSTPHLLPPFFVTLKPISAILLLHLGLIIVLLSVSEKSVCKYKR